MGELRTGRKCLFQVPFDVFLAKSHEVHAHCFKRMISKMLNEGNQIHNFISSSGSRHVISSGSGSDFLTSYGSYGSNPVPVPQHCPVPTKPYLGG